MSRFLATEPLDPPEPRFRNAVVASITFTFEKCRPQVIEAQLVVTGDLDGLCPVPGVGHDQHAAFGKDRADQLRVEANADLAPSPGGDVVVPPIAFLLAKASDLRRCNCAIYRFRPCRDEARHSVSDQKGADLLNTVANLGGLGSASGLQPIRETSACCVGGDTGRPRQHSGVNRDLSGGRRLSALFRYRRRRGRSALPCCARLGRELYCSCQRGHAPRR